ncbi:helix-turn-helix domain-containing protein [Mariniphaga sp.]|uniref:helix-turn-helix domain-containing protein n=1 Tax=Mariniphaga sp. TaxID=1954475 RepID=UPI00356AE5C0
MKRKELLKNPGYWTSKIQFELYDELLNYLDENNLNKTQFAKKLGVSKGYISQILNGDFNHKISKLVELSLAIDKIPKIEFVNADEFIEEDAAGVKTISWKLKQTPLIQEDSILNGTDDGYEVPARSFEQQPFLLENNA